MRLGVRALGSEPVGDPHVGPGAAEELDRHRLAARRRDGVIDGSGRSKHPLPPGLAAHAGRGLVAGDHRTGAHGLGDGAGSRRERLGRAREHVGDGALGDRQAEQAAEHLGQSRVADHVAAVQIGHRRDDAGSERAAGRHVGGRLGGDALAAARADRAMQSDARRDGLDRRQIDVVVGVRDGLSGGRERRAAGAALGVDITRGIGARAQLARYARPALAAFPWGRLRRGDVGLLPARRRQRRVRRRLRRLPGAGLEFGDPRQELLDLLDQFAVLREQPEHQRLQAVLVERIKCLGWHPELESDPGHPLNAHGARAVSKVKCNAGEFVKHETAFLMSGPVAF